MFLQIAVFLFSITSLLTCHVLLFHSVKERQHGHPSNAIDQLEQLKLGSSRPAKTTKPGKGALDGGHDRIIEVAKENVHISKWEMDQRLGGSSDGTVNAWPLGPPTCPLPGAYSGAVRKEPLITDQFTVVMQTYNRSDYMKTVYAYCNSEHVALVLIVWNNLDTFPEHDGGPSVWNCKKRLQYIPMAKNSMNNRFSLVVLDHVPTEAVFLIDDDLVFAQQHLEQLFLVWKEYKHALVGFLPRLTYAADVYWNWKYEGRIWTDWYHMYNIILVGASMFHRCYMHEYSTQSPKLLEYIDQVFNCDDLLMNFVVGNYSRRPSIWVKGEFERRDGDSALWRRTKHLQARQGCMSHFVRKFKRLPLVANNLVAANERGFQYPRLPAQHASLCNETFLARQPPRIFLFACVIAEPNLPFELLRQFVRHYLRAGVSPGTMRFLIFQPPSVANATRQAIASRVQRFLADRYEVESYFTEAEYDVAKWAHWRSIQLRWFSRPWDWVIHADLDELIEFPDYLPRWLPSLDRRGIDVVTGLLVDRVAADGSVRSVQSYDTANETVWQQYPLQCSLAAVNAVSRDKIVAHRGYHRPTWGHHQIKIGNYSCDHHLLFNVSAAVSSSEGPGTGLIGRKGDALVCEPGNYSYKKYMYNYQGCRPVAVYYPKQLNVHHFKWVHGMLDRMKKRIEVYKGKQEHGFWNNATVFSNAIGSDGRICVSCPENQCQDSGGTDPTSEIRTNKNKS